MGDVGTVLSVVQAEAGWFGEGDDLFSLDGEAKPSIEGTGSEDYFNDAWGLRVDDGPYAGVPVAEGTGLGSRMTAYRWHLPDPVPFTRSLRFVMEHKGWTFNADGSVKPVCLGRNAASTGYNLGVDNIVLARTGAAAWAAATSVPEPKRPSGSVAEVARALSDPDPVTRGLAATELRARGEDARPALDALVAALRDRDPNVRLMSGNAIAAIGPAAAPAVPALVAACPVRDEQVHVLRACATALGAIGRAAAPALPVLRELAKQPRVRWAAEAAIRSVEGRE